MCRGLSFSSKQQQSTMVATADHVSPGTSMAVWHGQAKQRNISAALFDGGEGLNRGSGYQGEIFAMLAYLVR